VTTINRKLARESSSGIYSGGQHRAVIIELTPPGDVIGFRLKGTRRSYCLPVAHCFREAMRNELARLQAERKKSAAKK
jgi:hypothetical protein